MISKIDRKATRKIRHDRVRRKISELLNVLDYVCLEVIQMYMHKL